MASTVKQPTSTKAALTVTGFGTLAAGNYVVSSTYTLNTNLPLSLQLEVHAATTNTPAGNKQVVVFAQVSMDGTNWTSGPTSGSTTTDEPDLIWMGSVPMNTTTTDHVKWIDVLAALGTSMPYAIRFVFKADLGVALTSASAYTSEVSNTIV